MRSHTLVLALLALTGPSVAWWTTTPCESEEFTTITKTKTTKPHGQHTTWTTGTKTTTPEGTPSLTHITYTPPSSAVESPYPTSSPEETAITPTVPPYPTSHPSETETPPETSDVFSLPSGTITPTVIVPPVTTRDSTPPAAPTSAAEGPETSIYVAPTLGYNGTVPSKTSRTTFVLPSATPTNNPGGEEGLPPISGTGKVEWGMWSLALGLGVAGVVGLL